MFTLKIGWQRWEDGGILADEQTLFIQADEVRVGSPLLIVDDYDPMNGWDSGDFQEYRTVVEGKLQDGRLIHVIKDGQDTWYTASRAWILGPTGTTIERVAP